MRPSTLPDDVKQDLCISYLSVIEPSVCVLSVETIGRVDISRGFRNLAQETTVQHILCKPRGCPHLPIAWGWPAKGGANGTTPHRWRSSAWPTNVVHWPEDPPLRGSLAWHPWLERPLQAMCHRTTVLLPLQRPSFQGSDYICVHHPPLTVSGDWCSTLRRTQGPCSTPALCWAVSCEGYTFQRVRRHRSA